MQHELKTGLKALIVLFLSKMTKTKGFRFVKLLQLCFSNGTCVCNRNLTLNTINVNRRILSLRKATLRQYATLDTHIGEKPLRSVAYRRNAAFLCRSADFIA